MSVGFGLPDVVRVASFNGLPQLPQCAGNGRVCSWLHASQARERSAWAGAGAGACVWHAISSEAAKQTNKVGISVLATAWTAATCLPALTEHVRENQMTGC